MEKDITFWPSTAPRTDAQFVTFHVLLDVILLNLSEVIHHCVVVDGEIKKKIREIQILWEK